MACQDHLIGSPLAFASTNYANKAWKRFEDIPALQTSAVRFVQGTVANVDCQEKHATLREHRSNEKLTIFYDYMIAASGLRRTWPTVPQALRRKEYLLEMATHIHATERAKDSVIVIGGGEQDASYYSCQLSTFILIARVV
jgi:NADH dehydrogenase FAD-containing subunit